MTLKEAREVAGLLKANFPNRLSRDEMAFLSNIAAGAPLNMAQGSIVNEVTRLQIKVMSASLHVDAQPEKESANPEEDFRVALRILTEKKFKLEEQTGKHEEDGTQLPLTPEMLERVIEAVGLMRGRYEEVSQASAGSNEGMMEKREFMEMTMARLRSILESGELDSFIFEGEGVLASWQISNGLIALYTPMNQMFTIGREGDPNEILKPQRHFIQLIYEIAVLNRGTLVYIGEGDDNQILVLGGCVIKDIEDSGIDPKQQLIEALMKLESLCRELRELKHNEPETAEFFLRIAISMLNSVRSMKSEYDSLCHLKFDKIDANSIERIYEIEQRISDLHENITLHDGQDFIDDFSEGGIEIQTTVGTFQIYPWEAVDRIQLEGTLRGVVLLFQKGVMTPNNFVAGLSTICENEKCTLVFEDSQGVQAVVYGGAVLLDPENIRAM